MNPMERLYEQRRQHTLTYLRSKLSELAKKLEWEEAMNCIEGDISVCMNNGCSHREVFDILVECFVETQ